MPGITASLAFINPHWGYLSQGVFCTLPIRPFWYRLALAWIPRYLIALIIIGLAIAIYTYVGFEFRRYSMTSQSIKDSTTTRSTGTSTRTEIGTEQGRDAEQLFSVLESQAPQTSDHKDWAVPGRRASSIAHDIVSLPRRGSSVSFVCAGPGPTTLTRASSVTPATTTYLPSSSMYLPLRRSETMRPPLLAIPSGHTVRTVDSRDEE
jgi:hypothetical protein